MFHSLGKVFLWDGRRLLALPEIREPLAFLYYDAPSENTDEGIYVPWVYDLDSEPSPTEWLSLRCRCGSWMSTVETVRTELERLSPNSYRILVSYVAGANRATRGERPPPQ